MIKTYSAYLSVKSNFVMSKNVGKNREHIEVDDVLYKWRKLFWYSNKYVKMILFIKYLI